MNNEQLLEQIEDTNAQAARMLHAQLRARHITRKSINEIYELLELQSALIADFIDANKINR